MQSTLNSTRFLAAYNQIDDLLGEIACVDRKRSFRETLNIARKKSPVVKMYYSDLQQYASLRNVIVHTRGEFVIAEPHGAVVERIEAIRDAIAEPPILADFMTLNPHTATPETPILEVLSAFQSKNISRCPVISPEGVVGLVTTKGIALWLQALAVDEAAEKTESERMTLREFLLRPVRTILHHASQKEYLIVPRRTPLPDALDLFRTAVDQGQYLQALLVTVTGEVDSPLVGIVAPSDLPKFMDESLEIRD